MDMIVYFAFISAFLFFFPIFISADVFYDYKKGKVCFGLYLFKIIKIYGGYATLYEKGIVLHLKKDKAVYMPFSELFEYRKKLEIARGFQITSYSQVVETGAELDIERRVYLTAFFQILASQLFSVFQTNKSFLSLKCGTLLLHSEEKIKFTLNIQGVFNMLVLVLALTKIILEKVINNEYKRKKQKV